MDSDLDEKPHDFQFEAEQQPLTKLWRELVVGGNPMTHDPALYLRHLDEAQSRLFCSREKMKFDILDILGRFTHAVRRCFGQSSG
jgi:hypothetical protein